MRFSDAVLMAIGQLRVNLLRTAFTLLGIVVSVGFLVAVVAIIEGMNAYVKENIADAMIGLNTFQVRRLPLSLASSRTTNTACSAAVRASTSAMPPPCRRRFRTLWPSACNRDGQPHKRI